MNSEFTCNSKRLADYLVKHGLKFIRMDKNIFIFEYDESIDYILDKWAADKDKCMFS